MFNYLKLLIFALLASFCLQFKFQKVTLAKRLAISIKRSALGQYINGIANVGVSRTRTLKQKHYNTSKKQLEEKFSKVNKQAEKLLNQ